MQGCMAETGASTLGDTESTLKTIAKSCTQFLGYENLKDKQFEAVVSFAQPLHKIALQSLNSAASSSETLSKTVVRFANIAFAFVQLVP